MVNLYKDLGNYLKNKKIISIKNWEIKWKTMNL